VNSIAKMAYVAEIYNTVNTLQRMWLQWPNSNAHKT